VRWPWSRSRGHREAKADWLERFARACRREGAAAGAEEAERKALVLRERAERATRQDLARRQRGPSILGSSGSELQLAVHS
jgi:predicted Zn-dependent protease